MIEIGVRGIDACAPASRRGFLRASFAAAGAGAISTTAERCLADASSARGRETAVIQIWLAGGPSHLDLYDMKPAAAAEYRGPFRPIATNQPGIEICELLPLQARVMDRVSIVRSLTHATSDHVAGTHWMQTGHFGATFPDPRPRYPSSGAVAARVRGSRGAGISPYIHLRPELNIDLYSRQFDASYLDADCGPLNVKTPFPPWQDVKSFELPDLAPVVGLSARRLDDRLELMQRFDSLNGRLDRAVDDRSLDERHRQAFEMLSNGAAQTAFDLSRESSAMRDRYGRNVWGQGALLCRRLIEAGATYVTLNTDSSSNLWDNHGGLEAYLKLIVPMYDRMLTALVEDLGERGLSERVLVLVCGEFGRTPKMNAGAGRDHWGRAGFALFSGGGLAGGVVVGATTSKGEEPADRPISPADILATVYRHLGIDLSQTFPDRLGRPVPVLSGGEAIRELV